MKLFTEHPETVGETYFEHMGQAFSFAFRMIGCGLACAIHGIFPFLFQSTGSRHISELYQCMVQHRSKKTTTTAQVAHRVDS